MTKDPYDVTEDLIGEPYTFFNRVVDIVFNFLTAVGVIAFAGICGYFWAKYL